MYLNEDYEISAKEFTIKAGETSGKLILIPKNNLTSTGLNTKCGMNEM